MPRLKVFAARMGFFDTVIAAASQKAALEAWGTAQNLFRDGSACVADDPVAVAAALARPGVMLRRAAGSSDPYTEGAPAPAGPGSRPRAAKKTPRPKPDRGALDKARAALANLAAGYERERSDLAEQAAKLKQHVVELDRIHREAKAKLTQDLVVARRAWRAAGGR